MSWLRRRKSTAADHETSRDAEVLLCIEGMRCSSCVLLIDEELEELPGVHSSRTSLRDARTRVEFDHPGAALPGELIAAVERAGYRAVPIN